VKTKRLFVLLFAIATLVLILYVRNEYNKINGVNLGPSAALSQDTGPAASVAATPKGTNAKAADAAADATFMGLPFGSDEKAILAKFGGQVKKLESRADFAFWYVDYIIPNYDMDGVPMDVYFQMDKDSHLLTQVLLRKMVEEKPLGVYGEDFKSLSLSRIFVYGMPEGTEEGDRGGAYFREEHHWKQGHTAINLSRTQKAYANGKTSEMLTLRFTQAG
jgi:hypothetical protein